MGKLNPYTRHLEGCQDPELNSCSCPKWLYENKKGDKPRRYALNTNSWAEAKEITSRTLRGFDPERLQQVECSAHRACQTRIQSSTGHRGGVEHCHVRDARSPSPVGISRVDRARRQHWVDERSGGARLRAISPLAALLTPGDHREIVPGIRISLVPFQAIQPAQAGFSLSENSEGDINEPSRPARRTKYL